MVKRAHSVIPNQDNRQQSKAHQLIHKAQAASAGGDLEAAEEYCGEALGLGYDKAHTYYALGVIYRKAGHLGLALNAFLNSINEKEDNVYALVGAAAIFVEQGGTIRAPGNYWTNVWSIPRRLPMPIRCLGSALSGSINSKRAFRPVSERCHLRRPIAGFSLVSPTPMLLRAILRNL